MSKLTERLLQIACAALILSAGWYGARETFVAILRAEQQAGQFERQLRACESALSKR